MSEITHEVQIEASETAGEVAAVVAEVVADDAAAEAVAELVEEVVEPLVELVEEAVDDLHETATELEEESWENRLSRQLEEVNGRLARLEQSSSSTSPQEIPVPVAEELTEAEVSETVQEIERETGLELAQFDPLEVEPVVPEAGSGSGRRRPRGLAKRR